MTISDLEISVRDAVVWVTLRRPEKRNAITSEMWESLHAGLDDLGRSDEIRALAIQGSGGCFTAGADLKAVRDADGGLSTDYHERAFGALAALRRFPRPTLAMIDGPCVGAGCSIALSCDVRFATPSSMFAIPAVRLGIMYEEWSVARLVDLIGSGRTSRFLLAGLRVPAAEAESWGLIECCTDDLLGVGAAYLETVCGGDPVAIAGTRTTIRRLAGSSDHLPLPLPDDRTVHAGTQQTEQHGAGTLSGGADPS